MRLQHFDVLAIGETIRDVLCTVRGGGKGVTLERKQRKLIFDLDSLHVVKELHVTLGGSAAVAAIACARLGLKAGAVSAVGRDPIGDDIIEILQKENVNISLLARVSLEQTGMRIVLLEAKTGESTSIGTIGANRLLEVTEDVQKTLHVTKWVYLSSLGDAWEDNQRFLFQAFEKENTKLAFYPGEEEIERGIENFEPLLGRADILVINEERRDRLAPSGSLLSDIKSLLNIGIQVLIFVGGKKGTRVFSRGEEFSISATAVSTLGRLGADEAFAATFVASFLSHPDDVIRAVKYAAINAASVREAHTAQKGLLSLAAIDERLNKQRVEISRKPLG